MYNAGDHPEDATVYIPFNTFSSDDPQASVTITNLADADIMVHKDGGTTQIATDGATVAINFDGITGNHLITVDTSAHADYSIGSDYQVRIEGTTVDTGTINAWIGCFSIENRFNEVNVTEWLGTAAATPTTAGVPEVDVTFVGGSAEDIATETKQDIIDANIDTLFEALIMQATTIATLASQTSFTLTAGSADDDAYEGATIVIVDVSTGTQKAFGSLSDYTGSTRTVTLAQDPGIFTMAATDKVYILPSDVFAISDRVYTGATHNVPASMARRIRQSAGIIMTDGTAQAGGTNNITLAAGESSTDNLFWQSYVAIVVGTGAGQGHHIVAYNGTTKVATTDDDWIVAPDATSEYIIYGSGSHEAIEEGTPTAVSNGTITLNTFSPSADDQLNGLFISIISGTGNRQVRRIVDYNGTTKVVTLEADWTTNPDTSSGYWIFSGGLTVNDIYDEAESGHNVGGSYGKGFRQVKEGTISAESTINDAGATTTVFITALTEATDNHYIDVSIVFIDGVLVGQSRTILSYNGTTKTITLDEALTEAPANGDGFIIKTDHVHPVSQIQSGLATEAKQDVIDANVDLILDDTNELQTDWTNGGRLDLILDIIAADTTTDIPALIAALNDLSAANVLTQVNTALDTAIAELAVAAPTATPTLRTGLMLLYMMARNRVDVDTTGTDAMKIYNDAGTQIASKTITDDGSDYSEAEMI